MKEKMNNKNLHKAKKEKNDEFYTKYKDIEDELVNYKEQLKDKVIYCNCDDPRFSNFFLYFKNNFKDLQLKKLITSNYEKDGTSFKTETDENGTIKTFLKEDGDFRSDECIELLKESDVIITNPPFSLFREYIEQLENHNKKYLIIGNLNAVTYKKTFKLIKDNKLWIGVSPRGFDFIMQDGTKKNVNSCWFTNIKHKKRNEKLTLYKKYNEIDYLKYENYNAINIDKVKDIPIDYYEEMGVPVTFLEKFNSKQFKIIGTTDRGGDGFIDHLYIEHKRRDAAVINGKGLYKRIIIKRII